jgi:hypothetical protein
MADRPVKDLPTWSEVLNMHWPPNPSAFRNRDNTLS